jgi:hypothetical protein
VALYLVCEYALDGRVLDQLVIQRHSLNVQIALAGGSSGLGAIRRYIESQSPTDVAVTIRDRDYDRSLAEANATWANSANREFIWRRHEIENYLLHPRVVLELFNDWRASSTQPWTHSLPLTDADVDTLLQRLATPLIDSHAAELLRSELTAFLNPLGSFRFTRPSPLVSTAARVPNHAQWRSALAAEASRLRTPPALTPPRCPSYSRPQSRPVTTVCSRNASSQRS